MGYTSTTGLSGSIPVLQIRHRSVVMYYELLRHTTRRNNRKTWQCKGLNKTAYSGTMTQGVRKRMTKAINVMLQVLKPEWITNPVTGKLQHHKLSFITLKISHTRNISARQGYDLCLSHFLDWFTRSVEIKNGKKKGVDLYVWKWEPQKDGQTHYHITTPDFIHMKDIRDKWNECQRKAGFLDEYAKEHGHYNANSTDIHEVVGVNDLASYIVKAFAESLKVAEEKRKNEKPADIAAEMGKEFVKQATDGKIWGCSELLSATPYVNFCMEGRHMELIEQLKASNRVREIADPDGRWCVWYFADCSPPDIMTEAEKLYTRMFLKWRMQFPGKGCTEQAFIDWTNKKPFLN